LSFERVQRNGDTGATDAKHQRFGALRAENKASNAAPTRRAI
jgi:hypothetical protein